MGISIHYGGKIDDLERISNLLEELTDIAKAMRWEFTRISAVENASKLTGIIVTPANQCEPLTFLFDGDGNLRCFADLLEHPLQTTESSFTSSTKTQFTSVDTHIWIIALLRYLKKHYLSNLQVTDEGDYWETEDRNRLINKREFLNLKIRQISVGFENIPTDESNDLNPSIEAIVEQIEKIVRKLQGD